MGKKKKQEKEKSEKLKKKKLQELTEQKETADSGKKKKNVSSKALDKLDKKETNKKENAEKKPDRYSERETEESVQITGIPDKYSRSILPRPGAETSEKAADVFRAFGDETRLQIMQILEGKELCNSELLQHVSVVQSTLSHHMRVLTDAGVVKCRRYGKFAYYSLCPDRFEHAIEWLNYYRAISSVPIKKEKTEDETESGGEDEQKI